MLKEVVDFLEYKNVLIPFELWSVAMETYFVESAKNCELQPFAQEINRHFLGFYKWYWSESFNDVRRSGRQCLSRRTAWFHLNCGL